MLKQIDHIGIAVYDLDEAIKKYENLFQVKVGFIETAEEIFTKIAFFKIGEVMLELLTPTESGKGPIGKFLEEKGEGFQHIAYRVENLHDYLENMRKDFPRLKHDEPRTGGGGACIAFLDQEQTGNVLTELVEREKEICL